MMARRADANPPSKFVKGHVMRRYIVALALAGLVSEAAANPFDTPTPTLRGTTVVPPGAVNGPSWEGFYFGVSYGFSSAGVDFSGATESLVNYILRTFNFDAATTPSRWPMLGRQDVTASNYGAFLGYNVQWDGVILGLEASYFRTSLTSDAPSTPLTNVHVTSGTTSYSFDSITGNASLRVKDYSVVRGRAGWAAGIFMPYFTAGLGIGFADYTRSATVVGTYVTTNTDGTTTNGTINTTYSETKNRALMYGWALGGGIDIAFTPNFFLRGEYEYVRFGPIAGITAGISTARLGVGLKF
jgi:opacity protein-like surface antigen